MALRALPYDATYIHMLRVTRIKHTHIHTHIHTHLLSKRDTAFHAAGLNVTHRNTLQHTATLTQSPAGQARRGVRHGGTAPPPLPTPGVLNRIHKRRGNIEGSTNNEMLVARGSVGVVVFFGGGCKGVTFVPAKSVKFGHTTNR